MPQTCYIENLETRKKVQVQFNPAELSFSKAAQLAEIAIPGLDAPVLQFVRGGSETMTLELFFDTTESGARVTNYVDDLYDLVRQDPSLHAPPRCRFSWGEPGPATVPGGLPAATSTLPTVTSKSATASEASAAAASGDKSTLSYAPFWFNCIVESVDRKFTLFSTTGTPLRARVTMKLREYQTVENMVARLKSADHTRARSFKRRERLDQIAATEYGSAAEWRRIAEANGVEDPRTIPPGTILKLPPMRVEAAGRRSR
jgi:hypothetical protein